jgi:arylsulfatase A-like enzyme
MGKSLVPILKDPAAKVRDEIVSEGEGRTERRLGTGHRMVRSDRFKYILSSSNEEAFFDLKSDPYEMTNRIADPSLNDEIEHCRKTLNNWMKSVREKRLTLDEINEGNLQAKTDRAEKKKQDKASPAKASAQE